jgi:hypothetical protein
MSEILVSPVVQITAGIFSSNAARAIGVLAAGGCCRR